MKLPSSSPRRINARFTADQKVFVIQMSVLLVVITLLNVGFYYQRELLAIDTAHNVQRVIRGWDGLAWYVWILSAPTTLVLIRRFPVTRERRWSSLAALLLGSIAIFALVTNLRYALRILPNLWRTGESTVAVDWTNYWHTQSILLPLDFLTYLGFFAGSLAIDYYFKYRQRME